jgi:hypothetical protein
MVDLEEATVVVLRWCGRRRGRGSRRRRRRRHRGSRRKDMTHSIGGG